MSPKVAFALFVFGCALLALVNAERLTRLQRRPVKPSIRNAPVECCPCPEEIHNFVCGVQRRHMRPNNRHLVKPEDCECPCDGELSPPDEVTVTPNPIATYEKDTPRRG